MVSSFLWRGIIPIIKIASFNEVYRYCGAFLRRRYGLDIKKYSYDVFMAYLAAQKTFDGERGVSFLWWCRQYLMARINNILKPKVKLFEYYITNKPHDTINEDKLELLSILKRYDAKILHDYYVAGKTLEEIGKERGIKISMAHKLREDCLARVKMCISFGYYFSEQIPIMKTKDAHDHFISVVGGDLLGHFLPSASNKCVDAKKDIFKALYYLLCLMKAAGIPLDSYDPYPKTTEIIDDVLNIIHRAAIMYDGTRLKDSVYFCFGYLSSLAKKAGIDLRVNKDWYLPQNG